MFVHAIAAVLALAIGPHSIEQWFAYLEIPVAPLNANLDKIVLPTRSSTQLTKVLIVGDSQSIRTEERWTGQTQKWDMQHVGMFVSGTSNASVGNSFSPNTVTNLTTSLLNFGDAWNDGNTTDHLAWSREWQQAATPITNFTEHGVWGIATGGFANAFDKDTRKNSRTIYRHEGAATYERIRLYEYRGSTRGVSQDMGWTNGSDVTDPVVFTDAGLYILNHEIRAAGTFGTAGQSPVGVSISDSQKNDASRDMQVLGSLIYNSPSGENFPSTGLIVCHSAMSGYSADDMINGQSQAAKDALVEAAEGFDLVIFMYGHNQEDSGDYDDNMQTLIGLWNTAHTNGSYATPDILCIAPWASDAGNFMTVNKAASLHALCTANGYGFISLWDSYDGVDPNDRATRLDGVSASYNFETSGPTPNVHPQDSTTAIAVAKDIEWHFQPANWVPSANRRSRASVRQRNSLLRTR